MYTNNSSSITWKNKLYSFLENKYYKIYLCIITIISLFLGDIQKISSSEGKDLTFDVIHALLSLLIFLEIIFYFIADESYGFSLFFFLDIIFLISLLFEITYIYNTHFDSIIFIKVEKILKLLRTLRIGKIITKFNYYFLKISNNDNDGETEESKKEEFANISSTFINVSSNKIFLFYCLLIVSVIIFDPDLYYVIPIYNKNYIIQLFSGLENQTLLKLSLFNSYIEFLKDSKNVLIFAKLDKIIYINNTFNQKLRKSEMKIYNNEDINYSDDLANQYQNDSLFFENLKDLYGINNFQELKDIDSDKNSESFILFTESHLNEINIIDSSNKIEENIKNLKNLNLLPDKYSIKNKFLLIYDIRKEKKLYCQLNILRTFFSISIFLFIYLLFLNNINNTVLSPIETMILKIKKMSKNPTLISEMSSNEKNQKKKSHCLNILYICVISLVSFWKY